MTTIHDYLKANRASFMNKMQEMTERLKDKPEELVGEELIATAMELCDNACDIYNQGYNACLREIEKVDINFLRRKLPPHVK